MASGLELKPPSEAQSLEDLDFDARVEVMVEWFRENYEDPAQETPYDSGEGGYQYIWGGPYEAGEELYEYFDATDDEVNAAAAIIQEDGTFDWAPAGWRIQPDDLDGDFDGDSDLSGSFALDGGSAEEPPLADRISALRGQLDELEQQLSQLQAADHGQIGHNQPPEDMRLGLEPDEIAQAQESINEIRAALDQPDAINTADSAPLAKAEGRFRAIAKKIAGWLTKAAIAGAGAIGAGYLGEIGGDLWKDPHAVVVKIHTIADTLQAWAAHLQIPF